MATEAGLTRLDLEWARRHFLDHVRSFGPLPALRCGAQPYGLLPVTSLDLWQPGAGEPSAQDTWLQGNAARTCATTSGARRRVRCARIGNRQDQPDPDADLADVMRTDAIFERYRARNVFGRHFLQHLRGSSASGMPDSDPAQVALLQQLGIAWRPRLARMWNADWHRTVFAPLVQAGEVSPWRSSSPNYIAALLPKPHIEQLILARPDPQAPTADSSLLQMLLRHALLREIAVRRGAAPGRRDRRRPHARSLRDAELVDLVTGAPPTAALEAPARADADDHRRPDDPRVPRSRRPASRRRPSPRSAISARASRDLQGPRQRGPAVADAGHARSVGAPARCVDHVVRHQAARRDARRRAAGRSTSGPMAGSRTSSRCPPRSVKPVTTPPAGEPGPLQTPANDSGFIHAPSMTHAAAAALLRNAHLGPTGVPSADESVRRSSCRRAACARRSRLLDGVRQGQPLGALLGYRVERLLHETVVDNGRTMDCSSRRCAGVAPLVARATPTRRRRSRRSRPNNVVDGLVLQRRWKEERSAGHRGAEPTAGLRHRAICRRSAVDLDSSATRSTA